MLSNFDFAKSRSISEIGFQIFACELKIYTFTILIQQHGVSPHSIIDFLGRASEATPSDPQNLYPLRGRVNLVY